MTILHGLKRKCALDGEFKWTILFFADMKAQTKVSLLFCKSNTDLKRH